MLVFSENNILLAYAAFVLPFKHLSLNVFSVGYLAEHLDME